MGKFYEIPPYDYCDEIRKTAKRFDLVYAEALNDDRDSSGPGIAAKVRNSSRKSRFGSMGKRPKDPGGTIMDKDGYNYSVLVDLSQFYL